MKMIILQVVLPIFVSNGYPSVNERISTDGKAYPQNI